MNEDVCVRDADIVCVYSDCPHWELNEDQLTAPSQGGADCEIMS